MNIVSVCPGCDLHIGYDRCTVKGTDHLGPIVLHASEVDEALDQGWRVTVHRHTPLIQDHNQQEKEAQP